MSSLVNCCPIILKHYVLVKETCAAVMCILKRLKNSLSCVLAVPSMPQLIVWAGALLILIFRGGKYCAFISPTKLWGKTSQRGHCAFGNPRRKRPQGVLSDFTGQVSARSCFRHFSPGQRVSTGHFLSRARALERTPRNYHRGTCRLAHYPVKYGRFI